MHLGGCNLIVSVWSIYLRRDTIELGPLGPKVESGHMWEHEHVLTSSRPHVLTSSRPHVLTSSRPHVRTSSRPHVLTSARPHVPTSPRPQGRTSRVAHRLAPLMYK